MEMIVVITLAGIVVVGAMYLVAVATNRMLRDGPGLRLADAVAARGLTLPVDAQGGAGCGTIAAVRRCVACPEHGRCDKIIGAADWTALRRICGNAEYIDKLPGAGR